MSGLKGISWAWWASIDYITLYPCCKILDSKRLGFSNQEPGHPQTRARSGCCSGISRGSSLAILAAYSAMLVQLNIHIGTIFSVAFIWVLGSPFFSQMYYYVLSNKHTWYFCRIMWRDKLTNLHTWVMTCLEHFDWWSRSQNLGVCLAAYSLWDHTVSPPPYGGNWRHNLRLRAPCMVHLWPAPYSLHHMSAFKCKLSSLMWIQLLTTCWSVAWPHKPQHIKLVFYKTILSEGIFGFPPQHFPPYISGLQVGWNSL